MLTPYGLTHCLVFRVQRTKTKDQMANFRRLLAYVVCVALSTPPLAFAQAAPPASASPTAPGMKGVSFEASEHETYARLLINWPAGTQIEAVPSAAAGIALLRLPRPVEADLSKIARSAPGYIAAAALSADKRTIRIALVQGVKLSQSRQGTTQAIDFVRMDAPVPPAFEGKAATADAGAVTNPDGAAQSAEKSGRPKKMVNGAAPPGAPRVKVEASASPEFTRLRLTNMAPNGTLPDQGYARRGDRLAIALPGLFALDIGSLRNKPPARVLDAARHSNETATSLVLDVEPESVIRLGRDGTSVTVDILPPGTNPDAVNALESEAAAATQLEPNATKPAAVKGKPLPAEKPGEASKAQAAVPIDAQATALSSEETPEARPDPAPSGTVRVTMGAVGNDIQLEFGFETPAPAVIFRRGNSIYALFATAANFDLGRPPVGKGVSKIEAIRGDGVSGIRIVAPIETHANVSAIGSNWRIGLSAKRTNNSRDIGIEREEAADNTGRIKALVSEAAASGRITDPEVGDDVLLGLALGPPSALNAPRSYLEAALPETYHGLAVIPRTEDFELRQSIEGFVLVRPNGMTLSKVDAASKAAGFTPSAPGFVDFNAWKLGPAVDFSKNLNKLRRDAAREIGSPTEAVRARLDLARFLIAWDLGAEAAGAIRQLKADVQTMVRTPEVISLEGIAEVMLGHGKKALEILSEPEVADDPASQLWAGLAAMIDGNAEEARGRFERGKDAIDGFVPEQRAQFNIANGTAALQLGDPALAATSAGLAQGDAQEPRTKLRAALLMAQATGAMGRVDEALGAFTKLASATDREIAARAAYEKARLGLSSGKVPVIESIRALDALRYSWRGDDLELEILRGLGGLYIKAGDIRSGLSTMASATTLRPDLPAARKLRDDLYAQFKYLFLEGGADGLDPVQALALFYDFRDLAPIGPDGDRMVRGLADRLVALDLLPQATQLLQHQVDKRLEGFAKAQVATDLAAIYLMDRRSEDALRAIWNSRVALLPDALNEQRRLIEAAALAEIGRTDHALEAIEFDQSQDAARLRAELFMRGGNWTLAAENSRVSLPSPKASLTPLEAGEVLRAAVTQAMAREDDNNRALVASFGTAMGKSAFAEAFKVVTDPGLPTPAALQTAVAAITHGSPYNDLMKRLRLRIDKIEVPDGVITAGIGQTDEPTDGNPNGGAVKFLDKAQAALGLTPPVTAPAPLVPDERPTIPPQKSLPATVASRPAPPKAATRVAQSPQRPSQIAPKAPAKAKAPNRNSVDAPRDPPVVSR